MTKLRLAAGAVAIFSAGACATLANGEAGLDNPPHAMAGPFRLVGVGELGASRVPPFAMDDDETRARDVTVIDSDEDPSTLGVDAYFAVSSEDDPLGPTVKLVRYHAVDGRSFPRDPVVVLEPTHAWEGGVISAPSAVRDPQGAGYFVFYAGAEGIGLATGPADGALTAGDAPVLDADDVAWADGPPRSPGVVQLDDGTFRMFFEIDRGGTTVIGEAESEDGVSFSLVGDGPVITPGADGTFDDAWVGSPCAVVARSGEGREILYVYYGARDSRGAQVIGLAARFTDEEDARFEKSTSTMYAPTGSVEPREPSVVRFEDFSLLFATQKRAKATENLVVIVATSPGDVDLPPPDPL